MVTLSINIVLNIPLQQLKLVTTFYQRDSHSEWHIMQRKRQKIFLLRVFSFLFRKPTQVRKGSKEKNIVTTDRRPMCCSGQCWWWALLSSSSSSTLVLSSSLTFAVNAIFLDIILIYEWRNLDGFFSGIYYYFLPNTSWLCFDECWCDVI